MVEETDEREQNAGAEQRQPKEHSGGWGPALKGKGKSMCV